MTSSRPDPAVVAAPRHAWLRATLTYLVSTLMLAYPALAGAFLVNPRSDQYIGGFPVREFGATALSQTGGFAQWNPYLFGGLPYVAAMHGDIFYPTFLLRAVMPTDAAMTWAFIIHVFLCGVFTYQFLRAVGLGFFGSLIGGLAYMLSGQIASLVSPGHDGKLYLSALFPLTLFLLYRGVRGGRVWAWGALAVVIGLAVLSPHPQLLQYLLLAAGAFALYLAFGTEHGPRLPTRDAVVRLGLGLLAVIVGFAMGAIQYWPVKEYVAWSPRAGGIGDYERAASYSMPIEEAFVNTWLPQFTGILDQYWGRNGIHFHSEYLGAAVLVLAGLAFGLRERRRFVLFWLGTGIVTLLWALGGNTPFYRLVYVLVPGTKFFRAPSTIFFITAFAVSVLAAIGVERLLRGGVRQRYAFAWLGFAAVVALLATTGGLTNLAHSLAGGERFELVAANASAVVAGAWRSFLFAALAAGALLAYGAGRLKPAVLGWGLAAIVAVDLWSVARLYWLWSPPAAQLYALDPVTQYLKAQAEPGRLVALPIQNPEGERDGYFFGDAFMVHDVRMVAGYHGNELGRYQALLGLKTDWPRQLGNPNLWRLTNLQYFYTNGDEAPLPGLTKLVGPVKNASGSTVTLYRMPGENPAAWVTSAIVKAPDDVALNTILDPRFNVRSVAVFDTAAPVTARTDLKRAPDTLSITTQTRYETPSRIRVRLSAPAPAGAALVVSENFYPGWHARVDGKPAVAARADYVLTGVELPAGAREVELWFDSASYRTGKLVTLLALVAAGMLVAAGALVDRRRARG